MSILDKLTEEEKSEAIAKVQLRRNALFNIHGRFPSTGEEERIFNEVVRDIVEKKEARTTLQRDAYLRGKGRT